MTRTRQEEYEICRERGHAKSSSMTASMPPWNICSKCGTYWRVESKVVEMRQPEGSQ